MCRPRAAASRGKVQRSSAVPCKASRYALTAAFTKRTAGFPHARVSVKVVGTIKQLSKHSAPERLGMRCLTWLCCPCMLRRPPSGRGREGGGGPRRAHLPGSCIQYGGRGERHADQAAAAAG